MIRTCLGTVHKAQWACRLRRAAGPSGGFDALVRMRGKRDSYDQGARAGACEGDGSWPLLENHPLCARRCSLRATPARLSTCSSPPARLNAVSTVRGERKLGRIAEILGGQGIIMFVAAGRFREQVLVPKCRCIPAIELTRALGAYRRTVLPENTNIRIHMAASDRRQAIVIGEPLHLGSRPGSQSVALVHTNVGGGGTMSPTPELFPRMIWCGSDPQWPRKFR